MNNTSYNNLFFIGLFGLVLFFAFFKMGSTPLLDAVESRNGVNAVEMLESGDFINLSYGDQMDVWQAKPPLSIWLTAASFSVFGYNPFALRFPMALATFFLFIFLYRLIRLYQNADFAFFSCLILLSVKGLVGRHIENLGEYDAIFTCFAVAGTYYFLKYYDFHKQQAIYWSAFCFGLSFLSKGFGVLVFLFGLMAYMMMRRQFIKYIIQRRFLFSVLLFSLFPLLWLWMNNWSISTTFKANFHQDFLSYTIQFGDRNLLLFFNYLAQQFEWWHYLFYLSIPIGFYLVYINKNSLETNFTTSLSTYEPTRQLPKNREFTIGDLLSRNDLKPNIQLLLFSICIWVVLGIVCTISQNEQYLAFALPFLAITTAATIFYLNHRYEWFRYIFIALLAFTFWGQLDYYVKNQHYPTAIIKNEDVLQNVTSLACDSDLPTQNVFLYLRFLQPNLKIINSEDQTSELVFCRIENQKKYGNRKIVYQNGTYALLILNEESKVKM